MALGLRKAFEKLRRPTLTVRRGRVPGIPVELYHELDEQARRIDGLTILAGANNDSIAQALREKLGTGAFPPPGDTPPPVLELPLAIPFPVGTTGTSPYQTINLPFVIQRVDFLASRFGGFGPITAIPHLDYLAIGATNPIDVLAPNTKVSFTHLVPRVFPSYSIIGQVVATSPRIFQAGSIRLRISSVTPSGSTVGGTVLVIGRLSSEGF